MEKMARWQDDKMVGKVEEVLPEDIDDQVRERILRKVADEIVKRRLTAPAMFILETWRPLNFVGSQAMIALEPFIQSIFDLPDYRKFALLMERDENVEKLIDMIETAERKRKLASKKKR